MVSSCLNLFSAGITDTHCHASHGSTLRLNTTNEKQLGSLSNFISPKDLPVIKLANSRITQDGPEEHCLDSDLFHLTVRCTSLLNTVPLPWKLASLIPVTFVTKHSGPKVTLWGCCFVVDAVSFHPYNKLKPFYYYIYYLLGAGVGHAHKGRVAIRGQLGEISSLLQPLRLRPSGLAASAFMG